MKVPYSELQKAFAVVVIAVIAALFLLALVHMSLTMHHTAVLAARNDRAINGIIGELGGRRAWTDGSYIEPSGLMVPIDLWGIDEVTIGGITIHGSGEVNYPGDVSEAAKEFWEAVMEAFPGIDWGS